MLTIRLQRTGKKNQSDFRIVLAEKTSPVMKKYQEVLGNYNPRSKNFKIKEERVKYWISQRVQLSPTVHNLFVSNGILEGAKVRAFNVPKSPPVGGEALKTGPKAEEAAASTPETPAVEAAPAENKPEAVEAPKEEVKSE